MRITIWVRADHLVERRIKMESWGWFFAEMDEIKVKEMMKILNNNDYEAVKNFKWK